MKMKRWAILALIPVMALAGCATTPGGTGETEAQRQFDFEETVLDNGLRVVTLEDHSAPIVSVQVWYHVGAKNENPNRQGFAHMFEHMMFRGTELTGPEEHFAYIRQTGGWVNAFTSFDYTAYVNTLPNNQLDLALWLEAERMLFLDVSQEGFDTERAVVEEERRQDLNEPYGTVFERLMPVIYKEHPYRWLPIGKIAHLRAANLDELKHFWDTYYVPSNATLVIVGAVSHEEALDSAKKYFEWIPKMETPQGVTIKEPKQEAPREVVIEERVGSVPLVRYAYRGVPAAHEDTVPLKLMVSILGGGESSRIYQDLVKEQKICQEAYAYLWDLEQDGMFFIGAELAQDGDMNPDPALAALTKQIEMLKSGGVTQRELDKARNQMLRGIVTQQLKVYYKAQAIGTAAIDQGDPNWLNAQLAAINAVTPEDIQRVAKQYCVDSGRTTMLVKPNPDFEYDPTAGSEPAAYTPPDREFQKDGITRPEGFPREAPMNDLLEGLPEVPTVEKVLPNGLKVVVVPNDEVPFTTITLGLKYGAWAESPETPGVASMALNMIDKGTENYSAAELAEKVDFNALTLGGSANADVASISATALADKLPLAVELLAEVLLRPTFPEDELAVLSEQLKNNLAVQQKDPRSMAGRELDRQLYGDHPYSRAVTGELEDVGNLTRDAILKWWGDFVRPDSAVLYVAGDVTADEAFALAEENLGEWTAEGNAPGVTVPAPPEAKPTRIVLVDVPGAVQSQIRVGQLSLNRHNPDYHKSRVFTQIFGGSFNSRLNRVIRVERGLTYGAQGYFTGQRFNGRFLCSTFTKTESTGETVQAIFDVIQSMREEPPTADEINSAKSYLAGSFAEDLETPQDTVNYQWLIEYNGLPKDYLNQALQNYKSTDVDDIVRIAHDYIDTDNITVVVAGDASVVKESLEKIAPVTVVSN